MCPRIIKNNIKKLSELFGGDMMEFENIQNEIRAIDNEISELNQQKRRLENEIIEAESALESAQKVRREFDVFVTRRRSDRDKPTKQSMLKSFTSFINKATAMLTGSEYSKVSSKVEELTSVAKSKIKQYTEDLSYCKSEIKRLKEQRESLLYDYNVLIDQQNESEDA